jgi:tRNA dimethylallyltransferase
MLERGIVEEVAAALADGAPPARPGLDGVGIREVVLHLQHGGDRAELLDAMTVSTRQYAKRQETWFRNQLPPGVLVLDAVDVPGLVAARIARAWMARDQRPSTRDRTR